MYKPFFTHSQKGSDSDKLVFNPNIILLNINTISLDKVNLLQEEICNYPNLDILCLVEIGVKIELVNNIHIDNYKLISYYCRPSKKCGGVGIWSKENLDTKKMNVNVSSVEQHFEYCAISFKRNSTNTIIINCYRAPSGDVPLFFEKITDVLNFLFKPNIKFVVCGDFNFDVYNSSDFKKLCTVLSCFNLKHVVGWPTRVTGTTCTIIDNIFVNFDNEGVCCVLDNVISDHRTVLFELDYYGSNSHNKSHISRNFNENNILHFEQSLDKEEWNHLYHITDTDEAFDYFNNIFLYYFNLNFAERRRYTVNDQRRKWVNDTIKKSSSDLKGLFHLKQIYSDLIPIYRSAKNRHTTLIRQTKKEYYQNKIINSDNPARAAWNVIAEVSNKKKGRSNITLENDDTIIENPHEVAAALNSFFIDAPKNIVDKISSANNVTPNVAHANRKINHTLFLNPFTEDELLNLLKNKLKNKKSAGPDDVPMFLIKRVLKFIIQPITYLVNLSFQNGIFPDLLKEGKVIPILKKNNPMSLENYRPVTVPFSFSKIFEYAYLDRLTIFLNKFNILSNNQHGFRSGRSTITATHSFYNEIIQCIDAGECPVGVFCDLSRAFDCVNHDILLNKLYEYGIRGHPLNWLLCFLKFRKQFVSIQFTSHDSKKRINSESCVVEMGVPQGSVLGPVLFILYINSLESVLDSAFFTMYADDLSLIISNNLSLKLNSNINNILENVCSWFHQNYLYFNADKTQIIRFHNRQKECDNVVVNINNCIIDSSGSDNISFLGIRLDECLNWKAHCNHLVSTMSSLNFLFKNMKEILTNHQLINLYYAQVESRLRYGVCFWGDSTLSQSVFISQKRILRSIASLPYSHTCRDVFVQYKLLTLTSLFIYEMCIYVFQNKHKFNLNKDIHSANTRQKNDIRVPFSKLTIANKSPNYLGPKIYNNLPDHLKRNNMKLYHFKREMKLFLVDKCFYSLSEFFA